MKQLAGVAVSLAVLTACGASTSSPSGADTVTTKSLSAGQTRAFQVCRAFVRTRDPQAEFLGTPVVQHPSGATFVVVTPVRLQTGGNVRRARCLLSRHGDQWKPMSIKVG